MLIGHIKDMIGLISIISIILHCQSFEHLWDTGKGSKETDRFKMKIKLLKQPNFEPNRISAYFTEPDQTAPALGQLFF